MKSWRFLDVDIIDGFYSAALFESIGKHVGKAQAVETILFWRVGSHTVYLGYHQCVEDEIHVEFCAQNNIEIVRRILGGGCGFCDQNQILYSVIGRENNVIPNDIHTAYKKVLRGVVIALQNIGIESKIYEERNAIYTKGRKISGNAQGRFDGAVMINGSLLIDFDFDLMDKVLKNPTKNLLFVKHARDGMITLKQMGIEDIDYIKKALRKGFEKALGIKTRKGRLTSSEIDMASMLYHKYKKKEWIYRMDIKRKKHALLHSQPSA